MTNHTADIKETPLTAVIYASAEHEQQVPDDDLPPMTTDEARALADDLIRDLAPHVGHPDDVRAVLDEWLDSLAEWEFLAVATAALARTYMSCLTPATGTPAGGPAVWPTETGVAP